jgi:hypothetical protein
MKLKIRKNTFRNGETAQIVELVGLGYCYGIALFSNRLVISFMNFYREVSWARS